MRCIKFKKKIRKFNFFNYFSSGKHRNMNNVKNIYSPQRAQSGLFRLVSLPKLTALFVGFFFFAMTYKDQLKQPECQILLDKVNERKRLSA